MSPFFDAAHPEICYPLPVKVVQKLFVIVWLALMATGLWGGTVDQDFENWPRTYGWTTVTNGDGWVIGTGEVGR